MVTVYNGMSMQKNLQQVLNAKKALVDLGDITFR